MLQENIINRYIKKINAELNNCGSSSPRLISLKVLYPSNTNQKELQPLLALCKEIEYSEYFEFEKKYIEPSKGEFRTLAFQNYKEAIRLSLIENKKEIFFTDTYSFYKEELVSIDVSKQNKLKEEKINEYWDAWLNDIKTNFENGKSTLWSYVVIPREKDGVYKEITGSSFLIFSDCISENTGILINKYCQDLLIECITTHYYDELITVAVRAAISQVMARNTAHNIASHVLAQLTDGDFLSKEKNQEWTCTSYDPQFVSDARIIYQIASLISYIKDRMEYLGDITFGIPTMQANKKLSEVQKELDKVWLLLDHISGLSEFRYTITFCADDKPIVDSNSGNLIPENDLTIAMTNDILGMQALFNIIENVIRNTAKHNQSKPDNKEDKEKRITTFYVNFIDYDADYYEVEIYDDVPVSGNKKFDVTEESVEKEAEYRSKTNTNTGEDISNIDWLVYSMNCNINCSVLDEDNKLRGHSLGILEMEASAAYLRKLDIVDIENDEYDVTFDEKEKFRVDKLNILKAFKKEIKDKDGKNAKTWLAYRIFISKPKEYLFVGLDVKNIDTRHLNKLGIDFISTDDFKKKLENRSVYHHQFVFHQECFTPTPEQKTQLPLRIVPLPLDESNELLNKLIIGNFAQIEEQVWSIWFEKIKGDYKTVNVMTSYQEQYHKQGNPFNLCYCDHSKEWDKRVKEFNDNNIHFLEPLSSAAQQKLPSIKSNHELADYIYELKGEAIKYKLFEAAISKVLVIDERIQRFSDTSYISTPNKDIFSKSHVTIPGSEKLKLDADNYDLEFKKRLENYIDTEVKTNTYKFMLIHFGILERLFKENPSEIEVNLKKWSEQTRVVVTSGRGRPKELLPPEICFVNLSSVLRIFTQTRNKYSINYLLNQARK